MNEIENIKVYYYIYEINWINIILDNKIIISNSIDYSLEENDANMIENNIPQRERLEKLNRIARKELKILSNDKNILELIK